MNSLCQCVPGLLIADGHVESHKWLDERPKKLVTREKFYGEFQ